MNVTLPAPVLAGADQTNRQRRVGKRGRKSAAYYAATGDNHISFISHQRALCSQRRHEAANRALGEAGVRRVLLCDAAMPV